MLNRFWSYLSLGLKQLRLNGQYLLVAVLLLVLPLLFIFVGQSFFETAYNNIKTVDRQSIGQLHDSLAVLLEENVPSETVQSLLLRLVTSDSKVQKIRILQLQGDDLVVVQSSDASEQGLLEGGNTLYLRSAGLPGETLIIPFEVGGDRVWQAFREVSTLGADRYIFSEHNFASVDAVLEARQQQTFLYLPIIFLFLMFLAYWLVRQTEWQKKHIEATKKLKDQMLFTNTIAHELRAPLTAIRGYASFLQDAKELSPDHKSHADTIAVSAKRLLLLINDFLEVARIQSGSLNITFKETDVRSAIRTVADTFKPVAAEKGLDLEIELPNKPILAETDTERLQQILTNIVSNSLKYTETGQIVIALQQTKLKTIITVKDTGHGISAEDQEKLFGAFTRVGRADVSGTTGTGLGMWITKQLVELLHGTVHVESIEGVGTHVKLTFDV